MSSPSPFQRLAAQYFDEHYKRKQSESFLSQPEHIIWVSRHRTLRTQYLHLDVFLRKQCVILASDKDICKLQSFWLFTPLLILIWTFLSGTYLLKLLSSLQTFVHNVAYGNSFLLQIQKFCCPQIRICLMSFKVIQILKSAVSDEMFQIAFSFQDSVNVTHVRQFFNFICVLQMFM